jgi:hypothetical protein
MYECGLHTKFLSEDLKGVSTLFRYGAASLGVKAEKFLLKAGGCTENTELTLEKRSVHELLVGFNRLRFGAVVDLFVLMELCLTGERS